MPESPGQTEQQGGSHRGALLLEDRQPEATPPGFLHRPAEEQHEHERRGVVGQAAEGQPPVDRLAEELKDKADDAIESRR